MPSGGRSDPSESELVARYAARTDEGYRLPGIPFRKIDPKYYRQRVENLTGEPEGVVVGDVRSRFLYLTEGAGMAMRYGIGIGRAGFTWAGEGVIQWRQKWPRWTPPPEMIARQPELRKYCYGNGGQAPGPDNPLGSRALYIFQNGMDTLYRPHGTKDWRSIGNAVSSGRVRLLNQDVMDLYERVPAKARIVVLRRESE
ncbi:L,D-transpeptidase [Agrobacterium sp. P15N1-A]|uniref:L,D-transpeptidase n=1 Tax=Agrobacterium sp. P15N1-A TaxID=3342820 RepID=UPI0037D2BED2